MTVDDDEITITVSDSYGPLPGARIVLSSGSEILRQSRSDDSGRSVIDITTLASEQAQLTVSASEYLPYMQDVGLTDN